MNKVETSYYKSYSVQALVYKHDFGPAYSHERQFDVAVRIGREDDPENSGSVFKLPATKPYFNIGDARRAGEAYARHLIDSHVSGPMLAGSK